MAAMPSHILMPIAFSRESFRPPSASRLSTKTSKVSPSCTSMVSPSFLNSLSGISLSDLSPISMTAIEPEISIIVPSTTSPTFATVSCSSLKSSAKLIPSSTASMLSVCVGCVSLPMRHSPPSKF